MRQWFPTIDEAEEWIKDNAAAGYADPDVVLSEEDIAELMAGKVLAQDGEYGLIISVERDRE